MSNGLGLLPIALPKAWASSPEWMSFSFAHDAGECPRRAALRRSEYPEIWQGHGYPPSCSFAGVKGTIVHEALAKISSELAKGDCASVNDPKAFSVLKELGGYSAVLVSQIRIWIAGADGNPRLNRELPVIERRLERSIPEMRVVVQKLLLSTRIEPVVEAHNGNSTGFRHELHRGTYFEVEVRHESLRWKGFVDFVDIDAAGSAILTDFKTGQPKSSDEDQIRVYALLWARDVHRNPQRHRAAKLILQYPNETKQVDSPGEDALAELEQKLADVTLHIRDQFNNVPPPANVSEAHCLHCDVRHLCGEYWENISKGNPLSKHNDHGVDCEITLRKKLAYSTWDTGTSFPQNSGLPSVVAVRFPDSFPDEDLHAGACLRIMETRIETGESGVPIITIRPTTEVFRVLSSGGSGCK